MLDQPEFARERRVDSERLQIFIDRGWISPPIVEGRPAFRDVDVARAALIADLADEMGVNDEGVDLVLDLLDQLYSLRFAFGNLIDALEVQPRGVRRHLVNDARRLYTLTQRGSRALR
ncbi:MAG: chaperone modulator CbpM [Neoaquamicrobium sediminum]|jgi:chaperone modulatory protein CbpM|uniref:chaperone modulator CbpM n=1 Tax=Neoaquamicrobium sediminum TaxID=1849104 RepID=UPI00403587B5